jgi:hypothetical protein
VRAGVEGTISQAVFVLAMRRTRYRGVSNVHLQHGLTATAIHLSRAMDWLARKPHAKTPQSPFAALVA